MSEAMFSDLAHRLARNFSWLSLQELVIRLIGLATAIYLARVLAPTDYGALGLALAIVNFASVLVHAGTGTRATRLIARDPATVPRVHRQIVGFRLGVAAVCIAVLAGFSGSIAPVFSMPPELLALCSLLLLRYVYATVWAFRGLDRMNVTAVADVVEKTLTFAGILLLVRGVGRDLLWAPVVEFAAAMAVAAWMYLRLKSLYPELRLRPRFDEWKEIAREALPFSLAGMLASVYLSGGVLLLGWLATAASAAMFLVAQKVMLTLALLLQVINNAAFPSASRLVLQDMPAALQLARQLMRYYLVLIVPAFLLVAFHAGEVLTLLFGADYREAGPVLVILLAALPFVTATSSLLMLLKAIPRPLSVLAARSGGAAVLLGLAIVLVPRLDAQGAAIALAVGEAVSTLLLFVFVRRATGGVPWDLQCTAPLAAGAAAAGLYALVGAWPIWLKLPVAAAVYVGLALALRAMTLVEIRDLSRLMFRALRGPRGAKGERERSGQDARQQSGIERGPQQDSKDQP
ncbi:MAG: flippase [Xanthomonadales bacterium]|nr:flippase [Xanthomonadales bacterium]